MDVTFQGDVKNNCTRKMETPKAIAVMAWMNKDMKYTLEDMVRADMAGQILTMVYTEKIREEASAAYSVMCVGGVSRDDYRTTGQVFIYCPMKPEKGDIATKIMFDEVNNLTQSVDLEKLNKAKEYMLKNVDDQAKTNNYWIRKIGTLRDYGVDTHTDYKKVVEAQTPESVAAVVKELLKPGNRAEVIMMPAE